MYATPRISLRRSCQTCIRTKRRCDLRTPQCIRCLKKNMPCNYDNQPFANIHAAPPDPSSGAIAKVKPPKRNEIFTNHQFQRKKTSSAPSGSIDAVEGEMSFPPASDLTALGRDSLVYEPPLPLVLWTHDKPTIYYLAGSIIRFPATFAYTGGTPFMHPKLYEKRLPTQIQDAQFVTRSYSGMQESNRDPVLLALEPRLDQLTRKLSKSNSFEDLLASVQALILYLSICLCDSDPRLQRLGQPHYHTLGRYTKKLWDTAPRSIPGSVSPWQAWIIAESVRRSILISYLIRRVYCATRMGNHVHTLFVESLPFDFRTSLWEAQSADAWASLVSGRCPSMVSYREYVNEYTQGRIDPRRLFETLLLVACQGKKNFEVSYGRALTLPTPMQEFMSSGEWISELLEVSEKTRPQS